MNLASPPKDEPLFSGWKFTLLIIAIILSSVGYLLFTFWAGWDQVIAALKVVGFSGIITTLAISFFGYFMRFIRWQSYLHVLNHRIPWLTSFRIYLSGFALTITPGKTGENLRSIFLKDWGVPYRQSFGMFLSERVSDVLAVSLIASIGLWSYEEARPVVIFFLILNLGFMLLASKTKWLMWIEQKLKNLLPARFSHYPTFLIESIIAFRVCFEPKIMIKGIFLGVLAWGGEGVACYLLLHKLGADISLYTTLFIYSTALLVGAVTFLPGGLGGVEFTLVKLFLIHGIVASTAVTVTLLIRLFTLWFSVVLGLIVIPKTKKA